MELFTLIPPYKLYKNIDNFTNTTSPQHNSYKSPVTPYTMKFEPTPYSLQKSIFWSIIWIGSICMCFFRIAKSPNEVSIGMKFGIFLLACCCSTCYLPYAVIMSLMGKY